VHTPFLQSLLLRASLQIEIKLSVVPRFNRGFHIACESVRPERRLVARGGVECLPLTVNGETASRIHRCDELSAP